MIDCAVFLCDENGYTAEPWAEAGYECWCVDLAHSVRRIVTRDYGKGVIRFAYGDARWWAPPAGRRVVFVAAFPPCTHQTNAGARDFQTKGPHMLMDGLGIFSACHHAARWSGAPFFLENPVGVLSSIPHLPKPDHYFDPHEYAGYLAEGPERDAEAYTKKTCLWTGNGFVMPPKLPVEPVLGSKMHTMPPGPDRERLRSATPRGFSQAVFEFNAPGRRLPDLIGEAA